MIGMHVGTDHAQHGQAFKLGVKDLLPLRFGFTTGDAAVHHGPTLQFTGCPYYLIANQPQIDVVERERQCHANPFDTGCDIKRLARQGQDIAQGVVQLHFKFVHGEIFLIDNRVLN